MIRRWPGAFRAAAASGAAPVAPQQWTSWATWSPGFPAAVACSDPAQAPSATQGRLGSLCRQCTGHHSMRRRTGAAAGTPPGRARRCSRRVSPPAWLAGAEGRPWVAPPGGAELRGYRRYITSHRNQSSPELCVFMALLWNTGAWAVPALAIKAVKTQAPAWPDVRRGTSTQETKTAAAARDHVSEGTGACFNGPEPWWTGAAVSKQTRPRGIWAPFAAWARRTHLHSWSLADLETMPVYEICRRPRAAGLAMQRSWASNRRGSAATRWFAFGRTCRFARVHCLV